jgi:hypothetical protein
MPDSNYKRLNHWGALTLEVNSIESVDFLLSTITVRGTVEANVSIGNFSDTLELVDAEVGLTAGDFDDELLEVLRGVEVRADVLLNVLITEFGRAELVAVLTEKCAP